MQYRFSGHESFPCRYAWLPKAYRALLNNPRTFADEEDAMVTLGIGKNMVRSVRFWMQVTGIIAPVPEGYGPTTFGRMLLDPDEGFDPYLEDIRTLWLLHWKISTQQESPLFAWDYLLNRWNRPEFTRSAVLAAFQEDVTRQERSLSNVTLEQHFDVFLHTYVSTRSRKGALLEDSLDCPLVELELLRPIGERTIDLGTSGGRRETVYAFRRDTKLEISTALFLYCLMDFWNARHQAEHTLSFRQIAVSSGSPGQILKLSEWELRERFERLKADTRGALNFIESAEQRQVVRNDTANYDCLALIYQREGTYV